ncbi:uncharacterized protein SOCE26_052670 [Sorangium cellulosum]|uniref:Uncharacterized protein n=2 Tax=Sorangium cellulosum TaxID=56 RepID=A0A2L0EWY1_SORCE|nr:uncharacterized protein SOCE26_052670 [Sorangium cellulosum]
MRPAADVRRDLEQRQLLARVLHAMAPVSLEDVCSGSRLRPVARARRAALLAIQSSDPELWSASALGRLLGLHHTSVLEALERAGGEVLVHLSEDGTWTWCGRMTGDLGVRATAPPRWHAEVSCPGCVRAWRAGAPEPRRTYHVEGKAGRTRCGRPVVPEMCLASAEWALVVQCEGCAARPRGGGAQLGLAFGGEQ